MKKFLQYLYENPMDFSSGGDMSPEEMRTIWKKHREHTKDTKGRYTKKSKVHPNAPSPGCKRNNDGFFICPPSRTSGGSPRSRKHNLRFSGLTPRKGYTNKSRAYELNKQIYQ